MKMINLKNSLIVIAILQLILIINLSSNYYSLKKSLEESLHYRKLIIHDYELMQNQFYELREILKEKGVSLLYDKVVLLNYNQDPDIVFNQRNTFNFKSLYRLNFKEFYSYSKKIFNSFYNQISYYLVDLVHLDQKSTQSILSKLLPTINPIKTFKISSYYGPRIDPLSNRVRFHSGVDLAADKDEIIYATAQGIVEYVGNSNDYGKFVKLKHKYGYQTLYAHTSDVLVYQGQKVDQSEPLALVGKTGKATGYHVHYEVILNGEKVDPQLFLYGL